MSRQTIVVTSAFTFSLLALLGSPAAAQDDPVAQLRAELEQQQAEMERLKQMVANMADSSSAAGAGTIDRDETINLKVAAVVTHRIQIVKAYRSALRSLVGSDPGADPKRWEEWLAERPANPGSTGTGR